MSCETRESDESKLAEMARTCACFNFRKASRSVTQLFDQILAPTGLRSTQLVILMTGQLLGPSSIARLAQDLVEQLRHAPRSFTEVKAGASPGHFGQFRSIDLRYVAGHKFFTKKRNILSRAGMAG